MNSLFILDIERGGTVSVGNFENSAEHGRQFLSTFIFEKKYISKCHFVIPLVLEKQQG